MSDKPVYEIVSPLGTPPETRSDAGRATRGFAPAAPLGDLAGKRIGFIWTNFRNGDILLAAFADLLGKRFQDMEFFNLPSGARWPGAIIRTRRSRRSCANTGSMD